MNTKITKRERRFLIIWMGVCLFAFLSTIAPIRGTIIDDNFQYGTQTNPGIWLFSSGSPSRAAKQFWPFTSDFIYEHNITPIENGVLMGHVRGYLGKTHGFWGIFNGFDYLELLVYSLLGLAIIFIPKIW